MRRLLPFVLTGLCFATDIPPEVSNLHSSDYLNRNFAQPLTGGSEFKTLSGNQTFRAPLECPSSDKAVVVSFIPAGNGEWRIVVAGDLNFDGNYEYHFDTDWLGIRVSGVCTSGVVYCNPYNVWDLNHCRYFVWTVSNGFVTLMETQNKDEVGACVCTNYSCNGGNVPPYRWVVGAISGVLMNAYPQFLISRGEWDMSTFSYYLYGQNTRDCRGIEGEVTDLGGVPLTAYEGSHIYPSVDLSDIAQEQGEDPSSPYNTLMSASQVQYNGYSVGVPNIYSCWIYRDVTFSSPVWITSDGTEVNPYCTGGQEEISENEIWCYVTPQSRYCGQKLDFNPHGRYKYSIWAGDDANCILKEGDTYIHNYRIPGGSDGYAECSYSGERYYVGNVHLEAYDDGGCYARGRVTFAYYIRRWQDASLVTQNNCHPDEGCTLKSEWICPPDVPLPSRPSIGELRRYCIQTVNEGTRLHPSLPPMCKTVTTEVDTYRICMDGSRVVVTNSRGETVYSASGDYMWFKVYREYNCGTQEMNIDLTKINQTRDSATLQNQNIAYTDYLGSGERETIYVNVNPNDCPVPSCVVRYPTQEADVFSDSSNRAEINATRNEYAVVECRQNSAGVWYCPVPQGGVILEPCSCTQDYTGFNLAVSVLQAVDQASHDIICSQE